MFLRLNCDLLFSQRTPTSSRPSSTVKPLCSTFSTPPVKWSSPQCATNTCAAARASSFAIPSRIGTASRRRPSIANWLRASAWPRTFHWCWSPINWIYRLRERLDEIFVFVVKSWFDYLRLIFVCCGIGDDGRGKDTGLAARMPILWDLGSATTLHWRCVLHADSGDSTEGR